MHRNTGRAWVSLFDHLVGAPQQREWESKAERLGGLKIDDKLDLGGLLDRQVSRLFALKNPAGIDADQTVYIRKTASVAHQAASRGELTIPADRGHGMAGRQCGQLFAPGIKNSSGPITGAAAPHSGRI